MLALQLWILPIIGEILDDELRFHFEQSSQTWRRDLNKSTLDPGQNAAQLCYTIVLHEVASSLGDASPAVALLVPRCCRAWNRSMRFSQPQPKN